MYISILDLINGIIFARGHEVLWGRNNTLVVHEKPLNLDREGIEMKYETIKDLGSYGKEHTLY